MYIYICMEQAQYGVQTPIPIFTKATHTNSPKEFWQGSTQIHPNFFGFDQDALIFSTHFVILFVLNEVFYRTVLPIPEKKVWLITKGQTKSKLFFQADVSSKKRTNEFYITTMKPQVDLFLFVFLEEIEDNKKTFRN